MEQRTYGLLSRQISPEGQKVKILQLSYYGYNAQHAAYKHLQLANTTTTVHFQTFITLESHFHNIEHVLFAKETFAHRVL